MILYGITLVPLAEDLRNMNPIILSPIYSNGTAFDGSASQSVAQLRLMMDQGPDQGYSPSRPSIF